jgi:hypothetical protein
VSAKEFSSTYPVAPSLLGMRPVTAPQHPMKLHSHKCDEAEASHRYLLSLQQHYWLGADTPSVLVLVFLYMLREVGDAST